MRTPNPSTLELTRNGEPLRLGSPSRRCPGLRPRDAGLGGSPNFHSDGRLGLFVMELSGDGRALGFRMKGAAILNVDANRPAGKARLRDGMLIRSVNGTPVGNVAIMSRPWRTPQLEEGVTVEVQTRGGPKTVTIQSP